MGKINWPRVILGGLLAGLVINAFEFVLNAQILATEWAAALHALGKASEVGGAQITLFNAWGFLMGISAVWLYAAIRPRYGMGPKTAVCAGLTVWLVGILLASVTPLALNLLPARLLLMGVLVGAVEVVLGTLLGAWLYKEAAP